MFVGDKEGRHGKVLEAFRQHVVVDIEDHGDVVLGQIVCNLFVWENNLLYFVTDRSSLFDIHHHNQLVALLCLLQGLFVVVQPSGRRREAAPEKHQADEKIFHGSPFN